jgi:hypothetical protein
MYNVLSDNILYKTMDIDTQYIIDLIETVSKSSYELEKVLNRPHLTMKMPFEQLPNEDSNVIELRNIVKEHLTSETINYLNKFNRNNMLHRKTILASKLLDGESMDSHKDSKGKNSVVNYDLYLNGDFEGGEFVFDDLNTIIKPHSGLFMIYPGEYTHHVTKLIGGPRYTIGGSFYARDYK